MHEIDTFKDWLKAEIDRLLMLKIKLGPDLYSKARAHAREEAFRDVLDYVTKNEPK